MMSAPVFISHLALSAKGRAYSNVDTHDDDDYVRNECRNMGKEAGIWRGDAVYTILPMLPREQVAIDAQSGAAMCAEKRNTDGVRT